MNSARSSHERTLSVVIPVFWNELSLPLLFEKLGGIEQRLNQRAYNLELIFVDDGSGDKSLLELLKIKQQRPQTKIVKLTRNFGANHASKVGFQFVTGDCFTTLAADLQDSPDLILAMLDKWEQGCKFVMCTRATRADPFSTRIFSALYYRLLRLFVAKDYPPAGFDVSLMDHVLLPYLKDSSKNINIHLFAYWLGFGHEVIHYHREPRRHGKSRWSFAKRFKFFLDSLLGFSIVPIRFISLVGVIVSLFSFGYGLVILVGAVRGHIQVRGFPTIVALTAFLFGIVIIMLGIIGEYLWRVFDEVSRRPESVIDRVY